MINVFKKRTSLYALTASALFLLQGVDASIASGAGPGAGGAGAVPGAVPGAGAGAGAVPGADGAGAVPGAVPGGVGANACNVASYKSFFEPLSPIVCSDRKERSMKYSTVMVKSEGANAVAAGRVDFNKENVVEGSAKTTKQTIIKLYSSSLRNQPGSGVKQDTTPQYGSAVFASEDGVIKLESSWIRDFDTGLYASYGGRIIMEKGKIHNAIMGAEAVNESLILLRDTEINVSGQQGGGSEEELILDNATGLRASTESVIDMKLGKVIVPTGGTVVVAENGGIIQLDSVSVTINGSKPNVAGQQPNAAAQQLSSVFSTDGGFISFKNGNISHSNSVGIWAFDNDAEDSENDARNSNTTVKRIEIDEPSVEFLSSLGYASYLIPKILEQKTRTGADAERTDERTAEVDFRIRASVKSSTINLSGERSIGVYLDNQSDDSEQSQLKSTQLQNKKSLVLLQKTTLNVPDGTAIVGNHMRGSVLIDNVSNVSGDSFLKALSTSEVSVFVNDSIVRGEAYAEKGSQGKLFLFNESKWHLTKSRFAKHNNESCEDSCISFVKLDNSTISFLPLQNDANLQNYSYQMLRIGNGEGTVYTASGDSHIYFGAFVPADASEDSQLSDRLLIHGDVSGKTKVHVLPIRQNGDDQQDQSAQGYKPQSISIIQVYGEAREDSFTLNDSYVTISGSPYQYILRAYGPTTPLKMEYFDNKLVKSKQIWDYRLESKIEAANGTFDNFEVSGEEEEGAGTRDVVPAGASGVNSRAGALGRSDTGDVSHEEAGNEPSTISDPLSPSLHTLTTEETVDGSERREPNPYTLEGTFSYNEELVTSDGSTDIYLPDPYTLGGTFSYDEELVTSDGSTDIYLLDPYTLGGTLSYNEELVTSDGSTDIYLLAVDGSEDPRQNANEVEYTIVGYGDSDTVGVDSGIHRTETGNEDHTEGGYDGYLESEASEAVTSVLSTTTSPVASTVSEGGASTDPRGARTSEAVTSVPSPTTSSVPSTVSEGRESTDQGGSGTSETVTSVPSSTTPSVASAVSEGGTSTDQGRAGTSETVTSRPSPTTFPVASAASKEGTSNNLARSGTSGHSVYTVSSNLSPSSRGRSSLNLISLGADSAARSDRGRISVISTDGISLSSGHTISNRLPSIESAASIKPSSEVSVTPVASSSLNSTASIKPSSEVSVKPVASSSGAVGRVLVLNNSGKETISSTCADTENNNSERGSQTSYLCRDGKSRTITGKTLKASEKTQHSMHAGNPNTVIKLEGTTISGADSSDSKDNVDFTTSKLVSAVLAEDKAEVVLDKKSTITSSVIGLEAQSGGKVTMHDGTVNAYYVGAFADSGASIDLKDTKINVTGDLAVAGLASQAGEVTMDSGTIMLTNGVAVRSEAGGSIKLNKVNITAKKEAGKSNSTEKFGRAAFLVSDNASVDFKNGNVVTDAHAVWVMKSGDAVETGSSRRRRSSDVRPTMNHVNIESSTVKVEGDGVYGIYFDGGTQKEASQQNRSQDLTTEKTNVVKRSTVSKQEKTPISITGTVSLKKTDFEVAKGIAIYGNNS
uniref:hypothetical protein n=1 Tax=Bartonella sp. MU70NMGDW TaxID=3243561 RepID=UPI0035CFF413